MEQLETQFYSQALKKFVAQDFIDAGFVDPTIPVEQFTIIQNDEATHTSILEVHEPHHIYLVLNTNQRITVNPDISRRAADHQLFVQL